MQLLRHYLIMFAYLKVETKILISFWFNEINFNLGPRINEIIWKKNNWITYVLFHKENLGNFTLIWRRFHNVMKCLVKFKVICYVMSYNLDKIGLNLVHISIEWALIFWSRACCQKLYTTIIILKLTAKICGNCLTVRVVTFLLHVLNS